MGMHRQEFLLSVISIAIANWTQKRKSFMKNKKRNDGPFITEILTFCKNQMKSLQNDIELELTADNSRFFHRDEQNNKEKIAG